METNTEKLKQTPAPAPTSAAPGRRGTLLPERICAAQAALIPIALGVLALAAIFHLRQHDARAQSAARDQAVGLLGELCAATANPDALPETLARIAPQMNLRSFRWIDATAGVSVFWEAAGPTAAALTALAPVIAADGAPRGAIEASFRRGPGTTGSAALLILEAAGVTAAALLVYALLYRSLRAQTAPALAICGNVRDYAAGIERQLSALRLSDTLGQLAGAWNQFLNDVAVLQQKRGSGSGDPERAVARYELRQLHDTLDRLPIGLARVQGDGRVQYANATAAQLLRCDPPQPGSPLGALLGEEDAGRLLDSIRRHSSASVELARGQGDQVASVRAELVRTDAAGGEALLFVTDTSPLREAEQARDNFLYHVTHELRTPLTNIQAYVETLTRPDILDERLRKECYNVIVSETGRLSALIEDILGIAQIEVGALRLSRDDVDLAKLVRDAVQDHQGAADEKRIKLSLTLPPKMPRLTGDKHRLTALVTNLMGNALKYTPDGGTVDVTVEHDRDHLRLSVSDTGIGIGPEDRTRVFEKFYRVRRDEVAAVKGSGLGLSIAREVARLHGGDITLHSELGKGSRFTLELPLDAGGGKDVP